MSKICEWFHHNGFKANPISFFTKPVRGQTNYNNVIYYKEEVLLGVGIDSNLTFKEHVTSTCSRANHLAGYDSTNIIRLCDKQSRFYLQCYKRACTCISEKKMMKSLLWDHLIKGEKIYC